jgi:hypothetical protein
LKEKIVDHSRKDQFATFQLFQIDPAGITSSRANIKDGIDSPCSMMKMKMRMLTETI